MSLVMLRLAKCLPRQNSKIGGSRAHILLLLADYSNDDGEAWPTANTLALDAGLTERTVRTALDDLERLGIISGDRQFGRRTRWHLLLSNGPLQTVPSSPDESSTSRADPGNSFRGSQSSTPENFAPDPGKFCTGPRKKTTVTPENFSDITLKNHQENHQGNRQSARAHGGRGSRISADWHPSPADTAFASDRGLDPEQVAAAFKDYWSARAGPTAIKQDWSATWRNWCRREVEHRAARPRPQRGDNTAIIKMIELDAEQRQARRAAERGEGFHSERNDIE